MLRVVEGPALVAACAVLCPGAASAQDVSEIDARPWVIFSIWGDTVIRDVSGSGAANAWNVENNYQAIKNTYAYEKVLTGGQLPPTGTVNYNWWFVH
ncbi:hypothetical protein ACN28S_40080 [Cystobacter fuscus]